MPRTLPLRVEPIAGEALDSWLEALCDRMQVSWSELLRHVGLPAEPHRTYGSSWLVRLTPEQIASLRAATGVAEATLHGMSLDAIGEVFYRNSPIAAASISTMLWLRARRSRFCPHCLADTGGRWLSWWRCRWAFACTKHGCLLVDLCPACWSAQRKRPAPTGYVPTPDRCMIKRTEFTSELCGHALNEATAAILDPEGPAIQAQSVILESLSGRPIAGGVYNLAPVSPGQLIADLAALGGRILAYAEPAELVQRLPEDLIDPYRTSPPTDEAGQHPVTADASALATAVAVTSAWSILGSRNATEAGARMRWLVASGRRTGAVRATNLGWGRGVSRTLLATQLSALAPFLTPSDQLRHSTHSRSPQPAVRAAAGERTRRVPSLLWPAASLPMQVEGVGLPQLRSALSVAVLLVGASVSLSEGAEMLGNVVNAQGVSRVLQRLMRGNLGEQRLRYLTELANHLDANAPPIDYARRRTLPCGGLLPQKQWNELCATTGVGPGRGLRLRLARCWLFGELTGLPSERCPSAVDSAEFRTKLANLPAVLTSEFHIAVNTYSVGYLANHGIEGEPLTWSPDDFVAANAFLGSGTDVEVRGALRRSRTPSAIQTDRPGSFNSRIFEASQVLPKARLAELYLKERRSLADISKDAGLSRQLVTRLAKCYNIVVRRPGRPIAPMRS